MTDARSTSRPARWIGAALTILATACAPTVNLSDPAGPKYEGVFAPAVLETGPPRPLRVVTFNIKLGRRIDRAIEVLRSDSLRGADVVALQEMDEAGVAQIARALGLNYVYYPGVVHPTEHRHFGPALLTPWPIERSWKLALPHLGRFRHQQRVATAAVLRVRGRPLQVYAVHLEAQLRLSDRQRADQVRVILADAARTTAPVVIAGDFNSYGIGPVLTRAGYRWTTELAGPTISIFSWDHIFTRGLTPTGVGVVAHVHGASDHHPVWAVLVVGRRS